MPQILHKTIIIRTSTRPSTHNHVHQRSHHAHNAHTGARTKYTVHAQLGMQKRSMAMASTSHHTTWSVQRATQ